MLKLIRDAVPTSRTPSNKLSDSKSNSLSNTIVIDAVPCTSKSPPLPPRPQPKLAAHSHPYLNPTQTPPPPQTMSLQIHSKQSQLKMLQQTRFRPQRPTQSPPAPPVNNSQKSFFQPNKPPSHSVNVSPNSSTYESPSMSGLSGGEGSDTSVTVSSEDNSKNDLSPNQSEANERLQQLCTTKTNPEMLDESISLTKKSVDNPSCNFPIEQLAHSPQTPRRFPPQSSEQFFETTTTPIETGCKNDSFSNDKTDGILSPSQDKFDQNPINESDEQFLKELNAHSTDLNIKCPIGHAKRGDLKELQYGLPAKFVSALRNLFDVFDDRKCGLVHLKELERRFDSCRAEQPPELLCCLQRVAQDKQDVNFEQFCAGVRICLLRSQELSSKTSTSTGKPQDLPDMSLVTENNSFSQSDPTLPLNNEKQSHSNQQQSKLDRHRSNGNSSFDSTQSGQSSSLSQQLGLPTLPLLPIDTNRPMQTQNPFPLMNSHVQRMISSPLSSSSLAATTARPPEPAYNVFNDFASTNPFDPSSSVEFRQPLMMKQINDASNFKFPQSPDPLSRSTLCPSMERLNANVRQLAKYRPASVPVDQPRRPANIYLSNNVAIQNQFPRTQLTAPNVAGIRNLIPTTAVSSQNMQQHQTVYHQSSMAQPPIYSELRSRRTAGSSGDLLEEQRRNQIILHRLNDWRDGVMRRGRSVEGRLEQTTTSQQHNFRQDEAQTQQVVSPPNRPTPLVGPGGMVTATQSTQINSNGTAEPLYSVIDKRITHRRRETRRHTMTNASELQAIKRLQQLEQEKELLLQGEEMLNKASHWYRRQIQMVEAKIAVEKCRTINGNSSYWNSTSPFQVDSDSAAVSANHTEQYQEMLNTFASRVLNINYQLRSLMDSNACLKR